jgi:3'(2'), 5'-bisphosphate nucleotidase
VEFYCRDAKAQSWVFTTHTEAYGYHAFPGNSLRLCAFAVILTDQIKMDLRNLTDSAIRAVERACQQILEVYSSGDFQAESKDDNSPLTLADKRAHAAIISLLQDTGIPVLSEEGKSIPYETRKNWEYLWLVDPLDGTKEFLKRNGEFTVNIALIHHQRPVLGVVAVPVTGDIFFGADGKGAFVKRQGRIEQLPKRHVINLKQPGLRVVASRSHMDEETQAFVNSLNSPVLVSQGSSLKFMLLAEDKADVYPRFAPTMEWDTAAAHAILNVVGLKVLEKDRAGQLIYNKANLVNPGFICH